MQKYTNFDESGNIAGIIDEEQRERRNFSIDQVSHSTELRGKYSCPTALASSRSGVLAFVAYTNDSLHMIDVRSPDEQLLFKSGGHPGMIKSIWLSEDETLLYTGGCDGTVRLWDMSTRSVIQTYGEEKGERRRGSEAD